MRKVEKRIIKAHNAIIVAFLALLGFASSCKHIDPMMEYGSPSAKYIVNGTVETIVNNNTISNIQVIIQNRDTVITDKNGNYQVVVYGFPENNDTFKIQFNDIDSTVSGKFENLDTTVVFTNPTFTNGDGHWYAGQTEKEFDVKLKPKK